MGVVDAMSVHKVETSGNAQGKDATYNWTEAGRNHDSVISWMQAQRPDLHILGPDGNLARGVDRVLRSLVPPPDLAPSRRVEEMPLLDAIVIPTPNRIDRVRDAPLYQDESLYRGRWLPHSYERSEIEVRSSAVESSAACGSTRDAPHPSPPILSTACRVACARRRKS